MSVILIVFAILFLIVGYLYFDIARVAEEAEKRSKKSTEITGMLLDHLDAAESRDVAALYYCLQELADGNELPKLDELNIQLVDLEEKGEKKDEKN